MRIAVIGAGSIGQRHAGNLTTLGQEVRLLPWRGFTAGALRDARPDAAVIATATQVRLELVALCADLGLPVYVEKPLAFDSAGLAALQAAAAPVANRSMAGFMMRWHPAFRALARLDLSQVYDAGFGIGHDVRLWRRNWSFAASYAALPQGGGVLLDLCHEIDMALTLLPQARLGAVQSLGHPDFPGVDFASRIALEGPGLIGSVAMDYLSPVSFRRICLRGRDLVADFDLIAGRYVLDRGQGPEVLDLPFERNQMFLAAMSDFLHLVAGEAVSDVEHLPRLDRVAASSAGIARAWETRAFTGTVTGGLYMIIGHIGARKGSKGLPGKNFLPICGKPLIDWSLDQLFTCLEVDAVVVSTDDAAIYAHAVAKGALEIGLRPAHLATDTAGKWGVWQHALAAAEALVGPAVAFVDLDCTSPLRLPEDIENALILFAEAHPDMVMSCCEARKNPYFNLVEPDATGALHVSKPLPGGVVARQQAPVVYEHAASTYVVAPDYLKCAAGLWEGRVIPYLMPPERCVDIDTAFDFKWVEYLLKERLEA